MRIRGATSELEEAGLETDGMVETTSQLRDLVKGMTGFDIMEDEDTFKSIYDIVVGIGEKWSELTDLEQASLLETLAGKRQGNALSAALNNIDMIKKAYTTAEDSEGSAMKEQETYLGSLEAKIAQFEAAFQSMSNTVLDSDLLKWFVDFGTTGVSALDGFAKVLNTISSLGGNINSTLGTIGILGGGILGAKNVGKCRMSVRISNYCFEYALHA